MPNIIVEDGSQVLNPAQLFVAGANSYAAVTDLRGYAGDRGIVLPGDDDDCAVFLLKAMDYIEPLNWLGYRFAQHQTLKWPRYDVIVDGWPQLVNNIPFQLVQLQCCVACEYFTVGQELMPTVLPFQHGNTARESIAGAIDIAYENNGRVLNIAAIEKAQRWISVLTRKTGTILVRV